MDQQDQHKPQDNNPIKKAAMATFGALSSAVEKVADVIGDAASKENLEKYAKKGEETFGSIKDISEDLFYKVKDLSADAYGKVKAAMEDPVIKAYSTADSARDALIAALKSLQEEAADAQTQLREGIDQLDPWADKLLKTLNGHVLLANKLAHRLQELSHQNDKPKQPEADGNEAASDENGDTYFDEPVDGDIPYDSPSAPTDERDRMEMPPADPDQASPITPDKESNTSVLETDMKNEHLGQSVPPPKG